MTPEDRAYGEVKTAAAAGDPAARRALADLVAAADTLDADRDPADKGRAEAERRYGKPPTTAA